MFPGAVRYGELRPGFPQIREVLDVEGEVERLSRAGWIAVFWPQMPAHSDALDLLVFAVGKAARQHSLKQTLCWVPDAWSRAAKELLDRDQLPIPAEFGHELNVKRLIRWLDPKVRCLAMAVSCPGGERRTIETLGEWFSRAGDAGCLILLPSRRTAPSRVSPTLRSEAEKALFEAINRDPVLGGLFEPNVKVLTRFQTAPCVDFLWREGRVIVEIDSYYTHGDQLHFGDDRQRDYETLASGYLTLRLLYEEVMRDCQLALHKVRHVVNLRRSQL